MKYWFSLIEEMNRQSKRYQTYSVWSDDEYGDFSSLQFIGQTYEVDQVPQYEFHSKEYGFFDLDQFLGVWK